MSDQKDGWDRASILSRIAVPLVVLVIGLLVNGSIKERELASEEFALALSILQSPDTTSLYRDELSPWALGVVRDRLHDAPDSLGPWLGERRAGVPVFDPSRIQALREPPPPAPEGIEVVEVGTHTATVELRTELPFGDHAVEWYQRAAGERVWVAAGGALLVDGARFIYSGLRPGQEYEFTAFVIDMRTGRESGIGPIAGATTLSSDAP